MSLTDALRLALMGAMTLCLGCGSGDDGEDPTDLWSDSVADAEVTPLPDFHRYVVGEVAAPGRTRDPFDSRQYTGRPVRQADADAGSKFQLRGIVESKGRLVALLGTQSVGHGDVVEGWKVIHLDAKTVVLAKGMRTKRLSL